VAALENAERTRQWLAEQIRREQGQRADKVRTLCRELQIMEIKRAELAQKLMRVEAYDPAAGTCPRCAILRGAATGLQPVSLDGAGNGGKADGMVCPECMWDDSVTM
jgi:hypothetical protein